MKRIVVDSSASLYKLDGVDIFPEDIYKYVAQTKILPKTAARSVADIEKFFRSYTDRGETVIHFNISAEMSSSHQNACIAAAEIGQNVYVVDSRNLSTGTSLLILDALDMIEEGKDAAQIAEACRARTKLVRASFVVDTLDYLKMGGRCSSVAALGANLLKLHPCIEVWDGSMRVATKDRGSLSKVILQYVTDKLTNVDNIRMKNVFITHTECDGAVVQAVLDLVKQHASFENIYETHAGCTINSHCGQGTLGILYEVEE